MIADALPESVGVEVVQGWPMADCSRDLPESRTMVTKLHNFVTRLVGWRRHRP